MGASSGVDRRSVALVILAVFAIVLIQLSLPASVTVGPIWLVPAIEVTGIPIVLVLRRWLGDDGLRVRWIMHAYLILLVSACVMNSVLLLISMLTGDDTSGVLLLFAGIGVLASNALSFGLVYWWLDAGGPFRRAGGTVTTWDFQFPQQAGSATTWTPGVIDYVYTAYTNVIAFSPTDTMPLTHRVKILFTIQSATALLTIVVTVSRAVNLIPGQAPFA